MNIFALDEDPIVAAQYCCDDHVKKMVIESPQMLSTAHRVLDGYITTVTTKNGRKRKTYAHHDLDDVLYKSTHENHPCNKWIRTSVDNYMWLYHHFIELAKQFELRYGKTHLSYIKLSDILKSPPKNLQSRGLTKMPLTMPDEYKQTDVVASYRTFYLKDKIRFATWNKLNNVPDWWRP